jgi:hypothetical protein
MRFYERDLPGCKRRCSVSSDGALFRDMVLHYGEIDAFALPRNLRHFYVYSDFHGGAEEETFVRILYITKTVTTQYLKVLASDVRFVRTITRFSECYNLFPQINRSTRNDSFSTTNLSGDKY